MSQIRQEVLHANSLAMGSGEQVSEEEEEEEEEEKEEEKGEEEGL